MEFLRKVGENLRLLKEKQTPVNSYNFGLYEGGSYIGNVKVGNTIVSRSGTRRTIIEIKLDERRPGGGFLVCDTVKDGQKYREEKNIQEILSGSHAILNVERE